MLLGLFGDLGLRRRTFGPSQNIVGDIIKGRFAFLAVVESMWLWKDPKQPSKPHKPQTNRVDRRAVLGYIKKSLLR